MLDLNNLRAEKHEGICKILDLVLVLLLAVFFILSLFPYFSVDKGDAVSSRGFEIEAKEEDSWSLLGYAGFPYRHSSVEKWQAEMYNENKSIIKDNEKNGDNQALKVPGITTKTVSIKQVGAILFLDVFALVGIALLLLKKGTSRPIFRVIWAIIGILAFRYNYLLNMSTNWVRGVMLAIVFIVLVVSLVDSVFYIIDGRSRAAYLRSVSAAYA